MVVSARGGRVLVVAVAAAALLMAMASSSSADDWASAEQRFVEKINAERANAGLSALRVNIVLTDVARDWSAQMRSSGQLRHRPSLSAGITGSWSRLGENVSYSNRGDTEAQLVDRIHGMFMASTGHRRNILGGYNQVGVGVRMGADGKMWVTVIFMQGPIDNAQIQQADPPEGFEAFTDVGGSVHAGAIEAIYDAGLTKGCSLTRYCTNDSVTRGEMATFLARAADLQPRADTGFPDVPSSSTHAGSIGAVVDAGISDGYADGSFRPRDPVTRAEMASFLVSAVPGLEEADTASGFGDVGSNNAHADAIAALAEVGITQGCASDRYCPTRAVTRGEIASFLARAYELD